MRTPLLVALLFLGRVLAAQTSVPPQWPLDSGARVRVVAPILGIKAPTGTLIYTSRDSLALQREDNSRLAVSLIDVVSVERSRGKHTRPVRGLITGLLAGALVGGVIGYGGGDSCDRCLVDFSGWGGAEFGAAIFGTAGAVIGLIVGAVPREDWVSVPLPAP